MSSSTSIASLCYLLLCYLIVSYSRHDDFFEIFSIPVTVSAGAFNHPHLLIEQYSQQDIQRFHFSHMSYRKGYNDSLIEM